ncbi:hypothetical protein CRYUN_Cryun14cG0089800 [Craigia yunnanensis]
MVVRDARGRVYLNAVSREDNIESALHAELKATLFGLQVTRNLYIEKITIESDSLLAIRELSKNDICCVCDGIISDILDFSLEDGS